MISQRQTVHIMGLTIIIACLLIVACGAPSDSTELSTMTGVWTWWEHDAKQSRQFLIIDALPSVPNSVGVLMINFDNPALTRRGQGTWQNGILRARLSAPIVTAKDSRDFSDIEMSPFATAGTYEFSMETAGELRMRDTGPQSIEGATSTWYRARPDDFAAQIDE